jgi:hypothetical protein
MEKEPTNVDRNIEESPKDNNSVLRKIVTMGAIGGALLAGEHKDLEAQSLPIDKAKIELQSSDSLIKEGYAHPYGSVFEKQDLLVVRIKSESQDMQRAVNAASTKALWIFLDYQNIKNASGNEFQLPEVLNYKMTEQSGIYTADAIVTMPKLKKG